ncbi:helix-turn-helix domain-containing protein [Microbacterium esteraromaticum]|uniref:PucR family transcriptional regulator n=1 Tax=Microbacterium esteraromaticum TaxID=57043 RepID=UPI00236863AB|nr:helix-turn-helix domain-containing protein [Microbacterium esteraromaticum]WDH79011.1 helix-turn-helix domain-containing protein [Microbacterium esteraromaticum]
MSDESSLSLARLLRETEGYLLPLSEPTADATVSTIDFDLDLKDCAPGAVVLLTRSPSSHVELEEICTRFAAATALVAAPGLHELLDEHGMRAEDEGLPSGPLLLECADGVTWAEVLIHLRQLVEGATSALAWPDIDDLAGLASVIANMTGASITIEDPQSRVLAHANRDGSIDEIRKETILTGAIPEWRIAQLEESGFLPAVRAATDVVERCASDGEPARSVLPLRSGGELLGTIWAAYGDGVDPASVREVLREAAGAARPVMLRTLRRSPFEKRVRREALMSILTGARNLAPLAAMLALPFRSHYVAVAIAGVQPQHEPAVRFHLRAAFADAALAPVPWQTMPDVRCMAVLVQTSSPLTPEEVRDRIARILNRAEDGEYGWLFSVGRVVGRLDQVKDSWDEAAYALQAAKVAETESRRCVASRVATPLARRGSRGMIATELESEILGLRVADTLGDALPEILRPAKVLVAHDQARQGQLFETLRIYFMTVGNSAEASRRLHVHANSLRNRLARIEELTGLSPFSRADRRWLELSLLVYERSPRSPVA